MVNVHGGENHMMKELAKRNPKNAFLAPQRDLGPGSGVRTQEANTETWDLTQTSEFNRDGLLSRETRASGDFPLIIDRVKKMAAFYSNDDLLHQAERTQLGRVEISALRGNALRFLTSKLQNEKSA